MRLAFDTPRTHEAGREPREEMVHLAISSCLVLTMLSTSPFALTPPETVSRLRCLDPGASRVVADARAWSPSVRLLIGHLERSDLVVYVRIEELAGRHQAETRFISAAPGVRYLMVRIDPRLLATEMVALFGHELQHVKEIADAPAVQSGSDVAALFKKLGWPSSTPNGFETAAAVEVGRLVMQELRGVPGTTS